MRPEDAFAGTFHVNESAGQLDEAYQQAASGRIPELPPCEAYCHSLTDPSILGAELRAAGVQTLTVFALHMPARLFAGDPAAAKREAVAATLRSLDTVLAESIEECLLDDAHGEPCLEARTPVELEAELAMPGGHIFHRDLSWPFAEADAEVGGWGVETALANVWLGRRRAARRRGQRHSRPRRRPRGARCRRGRVGIIAVMPLYTAMFEDIDRMDAAAWANWLSDDARFRFGNGDETTTRDAARQGLADFYGLIDGVSHRMLDHWENGATTIVRSDVTYIRKDGAAVTVPIVTIYHERDDGKIDDYRVYGDVAPVFA